MRLFVRTSRRTGVSVGPAGAAGLGLGWLVILALPIVAIQWCFDHWYTAPLGIVLILVAVLVVLGRIFERRP